MGARGLIPFEKEFPRYSIELIQTRNTIFDNGQTADDCLALMRVVK